MRALLASAVFVGACALATSALPPEVATEGTRVHGDTRHPLATGERSAIAPAAEPGPDEWAALHEEVRALQERLDALEQSLPSAIPSQER